MKEDFLAILDLNLKSQEENTDCDTLNWGRYQRTEGFISAGFFSGLLSFDERNEYLKKASDLYFNDNSELYPA